MRVLFASVFAFALMLFGGGLPAMAQTATKAPAATPVKAAAPSSATETSLQERMALATKMAALTPPSEAVNLAIHAIVAQAPQDQRAMVERGMTAAFEYNKFHDFVVKTMADTFTLDELKAMVAYYSSPEASSIARKMQGYEAKIQPKMTQMVDTAMMVVRTGAGPDYKRAPAAQK